MFSAAKKLSVKVKEAFTLPGEGLLAFGEKKKKKSTTRGTTTKRLAFKAKGKVKLAWPKRKKATVVPVDDDMVGLLADFHDNPGPNTIDRPRARWAWLCRHRGDMHPFPVWTPSWLGYSRLGSASSGVGGGL